LTPVQEEMSIAATEERPGTSGLISRQSSGLRWTGEIPAQKWMNFYTKVLTRLGVHSGLKLTVGIEYQSEHPVSKQKLDEVRNALRELGLNDRLD
jgi:hypothetical protein